MLLGDAKDMCDKLKTKVCSGVACSAGQYRRGCSKQSSSHGRAQRLLFGTARCDAVAAAPRLPEPGGRPCRRPFFLAPPGAVQIFEMMHI